MHELEDIYQIHRTNRKVLPRLLELLDNHAAHIDERINILLRLKADILNYKGKVREKLSLEDDTQKGDDLDKRSGDYQRRPDSYR
jgi:hypothetical protein